VKRDPELKNKRSATMSSIVTVTESEREPRFPVEASPSSRLRWSAILAGAVTFLSVGLLLWGLAFAIVSLFSHPWTGMMRGSALALWICAMGATIAGAAVGGWIAGSALGGAGPRWGALHGFVTWAAALIAALGLQLFVMRGLFTAILFESAENAAMNSGANAPPGEAEHGARVARDYAVGAGWSWFGTWLLAAITAMGAGAAGSRGFSRGREVRPTEPREIDRRAPGTPLTPTTAP
jgi:MFS family permease